MFSRSLDSFEPHGSVDKGSSVDPVDFSPSNLERPIIRENIESVRLCGSAVVRQCGNIPFFPNNHAVVSSVFKFDSVSFHLSIYRLLSKEEFYDSMGKSKGKTPMLQ